MLYSVLGAIPRMCIERQKNVPTKQACDRVMGNMNQITVHGLIERIYSKTGSRPAHKCDMHLHL